MAMTGAGLSPDPRGSTGRVESAKPRTNTDVQDPPHTFTLFGSRSVRLRHRFHARPHANSKHPRCRVCAFYGGRTLILGMSHRVTLFISPTSHAYLTVRFYHPPEAPRCSELEKACWIRRGHLDEWKGFLYRAMHPRPCCFVCPRGNAYSIICPRSIGLRRRSFNRAVSETCC